MPEKDNTPGRDRIEQLEAINGGMLVLAELALKQGDFEMAQKLRDGVAFATGEIERLKIAETNLKVSL